jgi:hypothetical protein
VIVELGDADRLVEEYCSYGAVSQRQLETCQTHISANRVRSIDTPASWFAQGDSTAECGAGSGPFCQRVLDYRYRAATTPGPVGHAGRPRRAIDGTQEDTWDFGHARAAS